MKGRIKLIVLTMISLAILLLQGPQPSFGFVIDFEGLSNLDVITNQYAAEGVTFENAIALVSGAEGGNLNEYDFPPYSGITVASPNSFDSPMILTFANPFLFVGGFFTYSPPYDDDGSLPVDVFLTLTTWDSSNSSLTMHSAFHNNTATGGELGSTPNEFLFISSIFPIGSLEIYGPGGGQWTLDNFTDTPGSPIPEPATIILVASGLAGAFGYQRRRSKKTRADYQ